MNRKEKTYHVPMLEKRKWIAEVVATSKKEAKRRAEMSDDVTWAETGDVQRVLCGKIQEVTNE